MCLLAIAYKVHPRFPLIIAANRDEFLDRPATPLHHWPDAPHILAGRDLKGNGTWLGISTNGRFAALTNHRDMRRPLRSGPSRGLLVREVLVEALPVDTSIYEGFNLIHGSWKDLEYHNNIDGTRIHLEPGIHGLSNGFLNTPWPKVLQAKREMERIAAMPEPDIEQLFHLLADDAAAPTNELPDTGVGAEWERILSSIRIRTDGYGTRCSTVIIIDHTGHARIWEKTWDMKPPETVTAELHLPMG